MSAANDSLDLRDIATALRHGLLWIAGGALAGLLLAAAVLLYAPPRYKADATVLLRTNSDGAAARLAVSSSEGGISLGNLADVLTGESGFKTELEILTSREVIGAVVDSLGLQARVLSPAATPPSALFSSIRFPAEVERKQVYHFERVGDRYEVQGPGASAQAMPGIPYRIAGGEVTLRTEPLPESFRVEIVSLDQAIRQVNRKLKASQAGGEVAEIVFRANDPVTSAAVPNGIIAQYLKRRRTTDRGVNQHRYEFLTEHTDSVARALAAAERDLRMYQERSGVLDPTLAGETELRQAMGLRAALEEREVESRALEQILAGGTLSSRDLAAYPTLLRNGAINHILARLLEMETRRTELLDRRTERDPDVVVLDQSIRQLENELVTLSRSYYEGLTRQQVQLRGELQRYQASLASLPEHAQSVFRLQREVKRLSETLVALQTQLVQTRLLAIAEGGDVRQIDVAVPPKQQSFPRPLVILLVGMFGGIFFGAAGAVGSSYLRQRIRYPWEAERATGVPATLFDPSAPLLLGGMDAGRSLLLLPLGRGARPGAVGARIASTATLQGREVVFADLEQRATIHSSPADSPASGTAVSLPAGSAEPMALQPVQNPDGGAYMLYRFHANGSGVESFRRTLAELESRFSLVVVALPG
ncbi:MAG TPA: Wzz/FepE/Etk N-terminal domain-containing protein, partial [Longimicrobiaceae bacterium]|nr:Wzz/FepE/Etk N-terminal domain-containing protein [Longimicrobiaceae bacterium]